MPEVEHARSFAKKIVGKNYVDEVVNQKRFVLVLYYKPKAIPSKDPTLQFWLAFADKLEANSKHLKIVYIDCRANDIPVHNVKTLPDIRIYIPA